MINKINALASNKNVMLALMYIYISNIWFIPNEVRDLIIILVG